MDTNKKPISELMTRTVCEVKTDFSAAQILELMQRKKVSSVLVVEDRLTLGIVTERDVVRNLHRVGGLKSLSCADLMQAPVITVEQTENAMDVYHMMDGRRIRHIAVTDAEGLLVGIVSESDFLRDFGVEHYMRFKDVGGAMSTAVGLLPETATVAEAVALMDERRQSCVFAVDAAGHPLGVLTERDVVRLCHQHDDPQPLTLAATMAGPVKTVRTEELLHDAVKLMDEARIRRLAVVDAAGAVCGVLTHHEIVGGLEGEYVTYLKDMIQSQEKVLISRQSAVNEKRLLENILRSAVGTAVIATDMVYRIVHCNPAVAAIPKLRHFGSPGDDVRDILARLGWPDSGTVLTPDVLRNGHMHSAALAWTEGNESLRVELQVSLLIDDKNQPQGYLLLAR
ncbi:MAG: CBS domain-containing protein [Betaproteobacteria bacterium]|nr:CBS domain-containing protein [Betaproteobacteria bacterium]